MNNCEKTAKLLKLASENPELPIIFEVDNEVVPNDEYGWYLGSMSRCRVGEYAILNEMVIDDREEFKERYYDYNCDELCEKFEYEPCICESTVKSGKYTQEEYERNCKNEEKLDTYLEDVAERAFQKAIILYIGVPNYENFDEEIL